MLLHLYLAAWRDDRLSVSRVTEASGSAPTTALRWLEYLENQGLVKRQSHPTDARTSLVELTQKACDLVEVYLSDKQTDSR